MLKLSIVDANDYQGVVTKSEKWIANLVSTVGQWLIWESQQAGVTLYPPEEADIILVAHAGSVDWYPSVRRVLWKLKIEHQADKRGDRPYIIAGGMADTTPFTTLKIADAMAVGEGYTLVRKLLKEMIHTSLKLVDDWLTEYPHSLTRHQLAPLTFDQDRPWLLSQTVQSPLVSPDNYVDWDAPPPLRLPDNVVRLMGSRGCKLKCKFCAMSARTPFSFNPNDIHLLNQVKAMNRAGEKCLIVTNDITNLPYFHKIHRYGKLAHQSLTLNGVRKRENREAIIRMGLKIVRLGIEGLSERIRTAFGKPIGKEELIGVLADFHRLKRNSHLFYIVGVPWERQVDWDQHKEFYAELTRAIEWGICRIKYTSFLPDPPSPLARFLPAMNYMPRIRDFGRWTTDNYASRHMVAIKPRQEKSRIRDYAYALQVHRNVIKKMVSPDQNIDLAPTLEDAHRLPWEIIAWPSSVKVRWRAGETYKRFMDVN
jgi:hypothetical protein